MATSVQHVLDYQYDSLTTAHTHDRQHQMGYPYYAHLSVMFRRLVFILELCSRGICVLSHGLHINHDSGNFHLIRVVL